jgi:hypothetical protein
MKWSIPVLFLVVVIYLLFFPSSLRPEIVLSPKWTLDVSSSTELVNPHADNFVSFELGNLFGYVSLDGDLLLKEEKLFGLAIEEKKFINFPNVPDGLTVRDSGGGTTDVLKVSGYPIFLDGRFLLISTNRSEVAELAGDNTVSWKREYTSVITDIDARGGLIALGLLDSRVQVLDAEGGVALDLDMTGSRINPSRNGVSNKSLHKVSGFGKQHCNRRKRETSFCRPREERGKRG